MQHEGRDKAAKVDENVAKWTKICRSMVMIVDIAIFSFFVGFGRSKVFPTSHSADAFMGDIFHSSTSHI